MIARSAPLPSSPAPSARRYAALGLDRSARPGKADKRGHPRTAPPPALAARSGEACLLGRDREVAGRYQLTTGGDGEALHLRHDRLEQAPDCQHQLCARGEQLAHPVEVAVNHVGEIMPRAEDRTVRAEDDRTYIRLGTANGGPCCGLVPKRGSRAKTPFGLEAGGKGDQNVGSEDRAGASHAIDCT
jgi:hypothetical protein